MGAAAGGLDLGDASFWGLRLDPVGVAVSELESFGERERDTGRQRREREKGGTGSQTELAGCAFRCVPLPGDVVLLFFSPSFLSFFFGVPRVMRRPDMAEEAGRC